MAYFHGGPRGLHKSGLILPPSQTGARCASDYGASHVHSRDHVYVTTDPAAALMYAALSPDGRGIIYEVEPIGELAADPDCDEPGISFQCPSARIIAAKKPKRKELARIREMLLSDAIDRPTAATSRFEISPLAEGDR